MSAAEEPFIRDTTIKASHPEKPGRFDTTIEVW
jgi:hypothetical protein